MSIQDNIIWGTVHLGNVQSFHYWGDRGSVPPTSQKFAHSPHGKFPPGRLAPTKFLFAPTKG